MVDIVMGYRSFDLTAEYPIVNNATRYFPLKQAQNDSQYTLGRTFLQDAYVIADYDRSNFSVSQAVFHNGSNTQQIVAIRRPNDLLPSTHNRQLSEDDEIGIVIATVVGSSIVIAAVIRYGVRKRTKELARNFISKIEGQNRAGSEPGNGEPGNGEPGNGEPGNGELENTQTSLRSRCPSQNPKSSRQRKQDMTCQPNPHSLLVKCHNQRLSWKPPRWHMHTRLSHDNNRPLVHLRSNCHRRFGLKATLVKGL